MKLSTQTKNSLKARQGYTPLANRINSKEYRDMVEAKAVEACRSGRKQLEMAKEYTFGVDSKVKVVDGILRPR